MNLSNTTPSICVNKISKHFQIYNSPKDRLAQMVLPKYLRSKLRSDVNYFTEFCALKDISFNVYPGQTLGIVGHNGSGKSTLLQIICGTLQHTLGDVSINGRVAALLELGSGFNPEFTGKENVYLNAAILGLNEKEVTEVYDEIVEFAEIGDFINQPVKNYSSGMMLRLAFSVAISVTPDVLVIDEALAVGDERFQRKCFSRLEEIKRSGASILFVSHSASAILELCDQAIMLDHGEIQLSLFGFLILPTQFKILSNGLDIENLKS